MLDRAASVLLIQAIDLRGDPESSRLKSEPNIQKKGRIRFSPRAVGCRRRMRASPRYRPCRDSLPPQSGTSTPENELLAMMLDIAGIQLGLTQSPRLRRPYARQGNLVGRCHRGANGKDWCAASKILSAAALDAGERPRPLGSRITTNLDNQKLGARANTPICLYIVGRQTCRLRAWSRQR
jgi:hypothetical protein